MGRFRFVEEIALADCAVDIEGRDLPDLFETAAAALAAVMVDPATVRQTVRRTMVVDAPSLDLLLYDWLTELLFRKDRDAEVFTQVTVGISGDGPYRLTAEAEGGMLDPTHADLRADPKAVTFHQFALQRAENGWRARLVIDI